MKDRVQLKREYYSQPELYFTPVMIEVLVAKYGEKPATFGEACYVLNYYVKNMFSEIVKAFKK